MASFVSTETLTQHLKPASTGSNGHESTRQALIQRAVTNPPPPDAFRGLRVGPELGIEYTDVRATPIDGSNPLLRGLSPFMIQVEPPLIYGADGALDSKAKQGIDPQVFRRAAGVAVTLAQKARVNLAQSGISGIDYRAGSPQGYVRANAAGGRNDRPGPAGEQADSTGATTDRLGQPAIADISTAVDISMQLSAAVNTPPLVLLVNPSQLQLTTTKVQQFQDRSRSGFIFHAWGEEQPKLSITAKCGAFISGGRGVSFASKRDSAAWQNLMNAFTLYRNNGYIYDTQGRSNAHHCVGMLSVWYDRWVYYGHMESFNYAYQDSQPHGGIEFSMEFTVSAMTDTAPPTSVVQPMRSPTPSALGSRHSPGGTNSPGVYTFDLASGRVRTQGQDVAQVGSSAVPAVALENSASSQAAAGAQGMTTQETGTAGFIAATGGADSAVEQAAPDQVQPFGS